MRALSFGFSPCPNDTFAFHALVHGLVPAPFAVQPVLLDIEALNRRAHEGAFDLTKLSVGAFAAVGDRYRLLRSGAALGHGVGPLVVARRRAASPRRWAAGSPFPGARRRRSASCVSRRRRSARWSSCATTTSSAPSRRGEVDAGLIIHESRFTYADHGLVKVIDLGDWWEHETRLPVPLAGICARTDLDAGLAAAAEAAIRASVAHAFAHPEASRAYVRAHSQEMSDAVCDQHIELYVNAHSLDIGDEGLRAMSRLAGTTLSR